MPPDPKPAARVRDPKLLAALHVRWTACALCDRAGRAERTWRRSLHHIHRHPRDDVEANLVMLCGDGTRGCHGRVEHADTGTLRELEGYLRLMRPDTFRYLTARLGGAIQANDWLRRLAASKL